MSAFVGRALCSRNNWDKEGWVWNQSYTRGQLWSRLRTVYHSYIHPPTPRQVSGSKKCRKWNDLLRNAKRLSVSKDRAGPWEPPTSMWTACAHNDLHCPQSLFWLSVWGNILSCLVVQVTSILSTTLCCVVFRPSVFLRWSVIKELKSPGKFCLPSVTILCSKSFLAFDHFVPFVTIFEMMYACILVKLWKWLISIGSLNLKYYFPCVHWYL